MRIAALVDDLALSQSNFYMIYNLNQLCSTMHNQAYCFYNNLSSYAIKPLFSIMGVYHAHSFYDGKFICTTLSNLDTLLKINTACDRYFYVWDLEWLRGQSRYMEAVNLMRNPKVKLLARSAEHAETIENYCNKPIHAIVDNWNYQDLEKI